MMKSLHPLGKLAVCMIWIVASILIFDMRFQLATILLAVLVLVVAERISPLKVLVLMAPFALFGLAFSPPACCSGRKAISRCAWRANPSLQRRNFRPA